MQRYIIKNHADSILPDGEWKLVWSDEFDGDELDLSKWDFRTNMMGKQVKHFCKDAISLEDSNLIFHLVKKDGVYQTVQLQTGYNFMDGEPEEYDIGSSEGNDNINNKSVNFFKWPIGRIKEPKFMHRYGYYECRCKLLNKPGWWSAFWLQSPTIGATLDPETAGVEVDIMEDFRRDGVVQCNNHWNGYGSQHESTGAVETKVEKTDDGYHSFGLLWTPDKYEYYIDGELINTETTPVSKIPQFILLTTEAIGYRCSDWNAWDELETSVGDTWKVDFVRVFDRK